LTVERVDGIGGVFFRAKDPEGNRLELWQPAPGK
jgi:predicted enzyme related to lactoylglutathione lyase